MHFNFFKKKQSLADAGVFAGITDWHCHVLPGVDDGIETMDKALAVLAFYEQIGVSEVWLTPHILEDMPNTTQELSTRFEELTAAYHGGIGLHLAAENMMDDLLLDRLDTNDVLPIGSGADHLLVEMSYMQPPMGLYDIIDKIKDAGYCPVVAHPERYRFMSDSDYARLKSVGCKLQLNILSLTGAYGQTAMKKANAMLAQGLYDIGGSDLHSLGHFQHEISQQTLQKDIAALVCNCSHRGL